MDAQTLREVMGSTLPNGGYTKLIDAYNNAARSERGAIPNPSPPWRGFHALTAYVAETKSRNNFRPYDTIGDIKRLL